MGYIIKGGNSLFGKVTVGGGKNAVLPLLSACLLSDEKICILEGCPDITDVTCTLRILEGFGCKVSASQGQITVDARNASPFEIPGELSKALRSSSLFLGAALGRFGIASQCVAGGCELGERPLDMHFAAFEKMGFCTRVQNECIVCDGSPHSADVFLPFPSVGATENTILAAAKGKGRVTLYGAAREPEITELCRFINAMGGKISGEGSSIIVIQGVEKLRGINYNIMGDRIEAATFMALAVATDGEITVCGANPDYLTAFIDTLAESGAALMRRGNSITVRRAGHFILSPGTVDTAPYPCFPTDAQSILIAMLLKSQGTTVINERIFSDRLKVTEQFVRMGADITTNGQSATVTGVSRLSGSTLTAPDLRSGAALVIAALCARGESSISNTCYIQRGYGDFVQKLRALGADITETEDF